MSSKMDEQTQAFFEDRVQTIMADGNIPKIYANGFVNGLSISDAYVLLQSGGQDIAVLQMSYTTAKTLAEHLMRSIQGLEERTGQLIMTVEDVKEGLSDLLVIGVQGDIEDEHEDE